MLLFFLFCLTLGLLALFQHPPQPPTTHPCVCCQCVVVLEGRGGGVLGRRRVRAGEDVSSLTPILSLTWRCIESPCKAHVITPPPRRMRRARGWAGGGWGGGREGFMREGGLTCSFTNASPRLACVLPKLNPHHLVSFPTFVPPPPLSLSSPACLSLQPQARYSVGERAVRLHTAHPAGINPARKRLPTAVVRHPYVIALPSSSSQWLRCQSVY